MIEQKLPKYARNSKRQKHVEQCISCSVRIVFKLPSAFSNFKMFWPFLLDNLDRICAYLLRVEQGRVQRHLEFPTPAVLRALLIVESSMTSDRKKRSLHALSNESIQYLCLYLLTSENLRERQPSHRNDQQYIRTSRQGNACERVENNVFNEHSLPIHLIFQQESCAWLKATYDPSRIRTKRTDPNQNRTGNSTSAVGNQCKEKKTRMSSKISSSLFSRRKPPFERDMRQRRSSQ